MRSLSRIIFLIFFLLDSFALFGKIPVNINSGNPNFPFPQFLEYKEGKTLAKYNAEGVTHADMEKAIREAYQVMANRFYYTGTVVDGIKYIRSNDGCPYDCAEGEGYGLLASAYMADKVTFNGIWMRIHDDMVTRSYRYKDGVLNFPTYRYGLHTIKEESGDAAADGDYDIALALLMATKQWGNLSGVMVANGSGGKKNMSYLEEALNIIADLVDTTEIRPLGNPGVIDGWVSGHIGIDGYPKGGNTFKEVTDWANVAGKVPRPSCEVFTGCGAFPGFGSYIAPAYFRSFAKFMSDNSATSWVVEQFKRAEASSDWLMAQSVAQGRLPFAGGYSVNGSAVTFAEVDPKQGKVDGESFRMAWRTILNGMWRGDGIYKWDPVTHTYSLGTNTAMRDNAKKMGPFLKDNGICAPLGSSPDPVAVTVNHKGISQIRQFHLGDGTSSSGNWTNYTLGTSAPSAVMYGDEDLIAELYRQCELKWDDQNVGLPESDTIITNSTPKYFHGWFRLLGMLTLTGNLHAPEDMVAGSNMKVYMSVDKTFAFTGDVINYTIDYRNYGKLAASGVKIEVAIPAQYQIVNAGGGTLSGAKLTFTLGNVADYSDPLSKGKKTFSVRVASPKVTDRVCINATISSANGPGWTSNEYPNNVSYNMQRNFVDILGTRSLTIDKTADREEANPNDNVTFAVKFKNSSDAGWLNGGRRFVNFSYAYAESPPNSYFHLFRNWNNAQEAYINLSNYRVSYFMFDNVNKGVYSASNPTGWTLIGKNLQTGAYADFDFKGEPIPVGDDNGKKWDQRLIIKFPPDITAPTHTVLSHLNNRFQLHKGTLKPIWYSVQMESTPPTPLFSGRVQDDWSFKSESFKMAIGSGKEPYFLIGPNYADYNSKTGIILDRFDKDACTAFFTADKIYDKLLVEEFDGYTWRRVSGEGPLPGREMYDVVVLDTLPVDFKFVKFTDDIADGVKATMTISGGREIIKWAVPKMLVGLEGDLKYVAKAQGVCPGMTDKIVTNKAWIYSSTDSPTYDSVNVKITCSFITPPVAATTMWKDADKTNYSVNDNITYKVKFKQTIGTTSRPALNDATRWTAINGTDMPKFTASAIDFDNGKQSIFIRENFSHGKNGTFVADIDNDGQETFGFVFRYKSGNRPVANIQGIYVEMQLAYWGNQANIKVYENGVLKATVTQESYAAPFTTAKVKFELIDGTMKMWLNDISGLPFKTFTGLTASSAGYAGFAVGDAANSASVWSKPKILSWDAHFDSGFNVEVNDPLPTGLTFVSADKGGTYTSPKVKWPKIAGPMLYNDSITYTVVAKLATCPANGKIINVAYVNLMGLATDSIGAQSVTTCGGVATTLIPGSINGKQSICNAVVPAKLGSISPASGGTAPYSYQWQSAPDSLTWTNIPSATDTFYTPTTLTKTTYFRRKVTDATSSTAFTSGIKVTVYSALTGGSIGAYQTVCSGAKPAPFTNVSLPTGATGTYNYKWESSPDSSTWTLIPAATNSDYSETSILTAKKYYRRVVTSGTCGSANAFVSVNVNPEIDPGKIGSSQIQCGTTAASAFTEITPASGGNGGYTYQWQNSPDSLGFTNIGGAINATYNPVTVSSTTYFRRVVNSAGCASKNTPVISVKVYPSISPGSVGKNDTVCYNQAPKGFAEIIPPSGGMGNYKYQWQSSTDSSTFNNIIGQTFPDFSPGAIVKTTFYRRQVFSGTCPVASSTNTITVTSVTPGTIAANQTICYNSVPAGLKNATLPSGGIPPYKYQWQVSSDSSTFTDIAGETFTNYNPPALTATRWYRRNVTGTTCGVLNSLPVKITVFPALTAGAIGTDQQVCSGIAPDTIRNVTLPTGGSSSYIYQWQISLNNSSWSKITGANKAYFKPSVLPVTAYFRRQVVSGTCDSMVTSYVKIEVTPSVTASVSLTDPGAVCAGEEVLLVANSTNVGTNPVYKWFLNGVSLNGNTTSTFKSTTLQNGDSIRVVLTSDEKCVSNSPVSSNKIIVNISTVVLPAVAINVTPGNTICDGKSVQFSLGSRSGQGSAPVFEWFLNDVATGITDTVYKPAALSNKDSVKVKMISNSSCATIKTVFSKSIVMTVNSNVTPDVVIDVDKPTSCQGTILNFSIKSLANGGVNPQYQWLLNGQNIVAATGATYSSNSLSNGDKISLVLTSDLACVTNQKHTSAEIQVKINTTQTVNVVLNQPPTGCSGTAVTLNATTSNAGLNPVFEWLVDGAIPNPAPAPGDSVYKAIFTNGQKVKVSVTSSLACTVIPKVSSTEITISVNSGPKAVSFSYNGNPYCAGGGNAVPTPGQIGTSGLFSVTGGLTINSSTGVINVTAASPGSYIVTNTVTSACGNDKSFANIDIQAPPTAGFTFSGTPFCTTAGKVLPVLEAGATIGTFSSSFGLEIDTQSGEIDPVKSTPGSYTVINNIVASGSCPAVSKTFTVKITEAPNAKFHYAATSYCEGGASVPVILDGDAGAFASTNGLKLNPSTGAIDPSGSTPGNYKIKNTIVGTGGCSDAVETFDVTIVAPAIPDFNYTGSPYCQSAGTASPTFNTGVAGVFTAAPSGLNISANGNINLTGSTPGTYTVKNTIASTVVCPADDYSQTIVVNSSNPIADFTFPATPYCQSIGTVMPKLAVGATPGVFTATPSGLSIDPSNGKINLTASTAGTYTVTNTMASSGGCGSDVDSKSITITAPGNADFTYSKAFFCENEANPLPVFIGAGKASAFSSKKGLAIEPLTGAIDLAATVPGTYVVINKIAASGGCKEIIADDTITVTAIPEVTVSDDVHIPSGRSTVLNAEGAKSFTWSPDKGLSCVVCQTPIAGPLQTTKYTVTGNTNGCIDSASVTVYIEQCGEIYVPNAFNPGSSGQNAVLCVYGICIEKMQMMIYDRWGEKVFESTQPDLCWDGRYNGTLMNSGEFVYVLKATIMGGEEIMQKGNISLIR